MIKRSGLFALALVLAGHAPALAQDRIARACLEKRAPAALCACIQRAANATLSKSDQRLASSFFNDPQKAQDIRQSDNRRHEAFWERYKVFGETAEENCG